MRLVDLVIFLGNSTAIIALYSFVAGEGKVRYPEILALVLLLMNLFPQECQFSLQDNFFVYFYRSVKSPIFRQLFTLHFYFPFLEPSSHCEGAV